MKKCESCGQEIKEKVNLNEIRKVVTVFKMVSGFEKDDKAWDRMYFSRYTRSAKDLIDFMGNWEWAADCVQDIYENLSGMDLTVTFETILKHAAKWKKDKQEREAKHGVRNLPGDGDNPVEFRAVS